MVKEFAGHDLCHDQTTQIQSVFDDCAWWISSVGSKQWSGIWEALRPLDEKSTTSEFFEFDN